MLKSVLANCVAPALGQAVEHKGRSAGLGLHVGCVGFSAVPCRAEEVKNRLQDKQVIELIDIQGAARGAGMVQLVGSLGTESNRVGGENRVRPMAMTGCRRMWASALFRQNED